MNHNPSILACLFASIISSASLAAPTGGGYDLTWSTIDGGGGTSSGGAFILSGTIGQHDAQPAAMTGGGFTLTGGFWAGAPDAGPPTCTGDLNNSGIVDGIDLGILLSQWAGDGSADLNNDSIVNGIDLGILLNAWGLCR